MIGLFLIYFIGKSYFDLAIKNDKNKWLYAFLGVLIYYGSAYLFAILLSAVISATGHDEFLDSLSDLKLGLMSLPIGILSVVGVFKLLEKKWSGSKPFNSNHHEKVLDDLFV